MTSGSDGTRAQHNCFESGCVGDGKGLGDLPGQSPLGADEKTKAGNTHTKTGLLAKPQCFFSQMSHCLLAGSKRMP